MRRNTFSIITAVAIALILTGCFTPEGETGSEQRQTLRDLRDDTLAELYARRPQARDEVAVSAGTGVFQVGGAQLGLGGAFGYGVGTETSSGNETFMRMTELQAGIGFGVRGARYVFIFRNQETFDRFTAGTWDFGATAEAGAEADSGGGTASANVMWDVDPLVYLVDQTGVSIAANVSGIRFSPWNSLN